MGEVLASAPVKCSDPTLRGRRPHITTTVQPDYNRSRPDLEGTANLCRVGQGKESFRPDLEGTVKRQVLGCGLRVVS